MYFPVRCFTCGAVIGHLYEDYLSMINENKEPAEVLDKLGIERYCCRRMFLSHVDVIDKIVKYRKY
jgi:DNA-directed RNA polymerase subunit N (RpoN/RPB10)